MDSKCASIIAVSAWRLATSASSSLVESASSASEAAGAQPPRGGALGAPGGGRQPSARAPGGAVASAENSSGSSVTKAEVVVHVAKGAASVACAGDSAASGPSSKWPTEANSHSGRASWAMTAPASPGGARGGPCDARAASGDRGRIESEKRALPAAGAPSPPPPGDASAADARAKADAAAALAPGEGAGSGCSEKVPAAPAVTAPAGGPTAPPPAAGSSAASVL